MMSDVLAYVKDQAVLITGLTNPQVIRTAEMMDMDLYRLCAEQTAHRGDACPCGRARYGGDGYPKRMYEACRTLYTAGLYRSGGLEPCTERTVDLWVSHCIFISMWTVKTSLRREASVQVKKHLRQLGMPAETIRCVSIAMYEGEINMVIHAGGGMPMFMWRKRKSQLCWRITARGFRM